MNSHSTNNAEQLELKRLNDDSSWLVRMGDSHFLLDPWLFGDDVNVATWFSRQSLATPTMALDALPPIDFILLSHPFSDHCSEQTLVHFPKTTPLYAVPAAAKRVARMRHFARIETLQDWRKTQSTQRIGAIEVTFYAARKTLDLTHNILVIRDTRSGKSIFYAPHGCAVPSDAPVQSVLADSRPNILLTTFRYYGLPQWLGGTVNLGSESALPLVRFLNPQRVVRTHDALKHEAGIVTHVAKQFIHPHPEQALSSAGLSVQYSAAAVGEIIAA
jgi:L-ascorbate metabolism protein UlaG (beta-lactamase superfamily)